jgi:hypothetical protein
MSNHKCPVTGCSITVGSHHLMCGSHWACVPKRLADEVYRTYRAAPHTEPHLAAMRAAILAVNSIVANQYGPARELHGKPKRPPVREVLSRSEISSNLQPSH